MDNPATLKEILEKIKQRYYLSLEIQNRCHNSPFLIELLKSMRFAKIALLNPYATKESFITEFNIDENDFDVRKIYLHNDYLYALTYSEMEYMIPLRYIDNPNLVFDELVEKLSHLKKDEEELKKKEKQKRYEQYLKLKEEFCADDVIKSNFDKS